MSDWRMELAMRQATYIQSLLPPGVVREALGLAIKSGQIETVQDALFAAKRDLCGLGMMVDHWISVVGNEVNDIK